MQLNSHPASFRDPEGQIFFHQNKLIRKLSGNGIKSYKMLRESGLYEELISDKKLIPHHEVEESSEGLFLSPDLIENISYPYEWSFSALKDAALLTLDLQFNALKRGMTLKDATAYNVQFYKGKPCFIDLSSFEEYNEGEPWIAYKQFCQHFLAPLALMSKVNINLNALAKNYIDGIPLDLAVSMLPTLSRYRPGLYMHLTLHSKMQKNYADLGEKTESKKRSISKNNLLGIIDSLKSTVNSLSLKNVDTEWGDYYNNTNYNDESFENKKKLVESFGLSVEPSTVWDLGANRGVFTRIFSDKGINSVAWDIDPVAVERNYNQIKKENNENLTAALIDLTNPTPGIGFQNTERDSFETRAQRCDLILSLALIHHLAISNNLPLDRVAEYFSKLSENLIIEFVPKSDSQVKILLSSRKDIFPNYTLDGFKEAFSQYFEIVKEENVKGSERTLFLMKKK